MIRRPLLVAGLVLLVAACTGSTSPAPTSTPRPTPGPAFTLAELKLALIDAYGPLWYCDPDFYPIQRQDEIDSARERWPEVLADAEAFEAITAKLGLDPAADLSDDQKLGVYRAWKMLNAIRLEAIANGSFRFDYLALPFGGAASGIRTTGTITEDGRLFAEQAAEAGEPICPICLVAGTRIETPEGDTAVEVLRVGDTVWTLDRDGAKVAARITAVGSTEAPPGHRVVRLVLLDGRSLMASPGHPLADGRRLGDLALGDLVNDSPVITAALVAYHDARTWDIAVDGPTGAYLVNGIALGSTIRP